MRRFFLIALFSILGSSTSLAQTGNSGTVTPTTYRATSENRARFVLSRIDERVVKEFENAWNKSFHGTRMTEALVLIFRMADGSIRAVPGGHTNEPFKFTFEWKQATIAVIHTHCNKKAPEPQPPDIMIAERFGVPMFTITLNGMYMYDPSTKKTSKVLDGLDWLNLSSWAQYSPLAADDRIAKK